LREAFEALDDLLSTLRLGFRATLGTARRDTLPLAKPFLRQHDAPFARRLGRREWLRCWRRRFQLVQNALQHADARRQREPIGDDLPPAPSVYLVKIQNRLSLSAA
jgi:hypothetical protein